MCIKLHLGCWHRYLPGWVHIDLCDLPHIDYMSSIDNLSMFDNDSVDIIYASHCLEYFDVVEAPGVLREWKRVLKKGGCLRIAVPDFDALIEVYGSTGSLDKILGPLYGRMEIKDKTSVKTLYHKTVYNFKTITMLLTKNDFQDVKKYRWQDTEHKLYDDHSQAYFPHMDKENGTLISLNVEAVKK